MTSSARRVLGVVPARGGSKGIPRKNIAPVAGRPLILHTLDAAAAASLLTRTVVSTDDEEIASVCRAVGADVPFIRPAALAGDDALTLPVVRHALEFVEDQEGEQYDLVVLLQPTCPLRTAGDIDACVDLLVGRDAVSVVSIVDVGPSHPMRMKQIADDGRLVNYVNQGYEDMRPRQQLPRVYIRNGAVYATRRTAIVDGGSLVGDPCFGYEMPEARSVNIDGPFDLLLAQHLLST